MKFDELKQARKEKGLSLKRISKETKIPVKNLAALEEGDFNCFPGRFYAKSFLKTYAKYLGVDVDLAQLNGIAEGPLPDEKHRILFIPKDKIAKKENIKSTKSAKSTKKFLSNVIGISVIIVLLFYGLFYLVERKIDSSAFKVGDVEKEAVQISEQNALLPSLTEKIMIKGITEEPVWIRIVADDVLKEERILPANATYYWTADDSLKMRIGYVDGIKIYYRRSETDSFREVDVVSGSSGNVNELEFSK